MTILFIGPLKAEFVKNDIAILSSKYKLILHDTTIGRGPAALFSLIASYIKSCFKVLKSDIVYCWFADYTTSAPAMFAKIIGKKVFVVAGGFDVGYVPELNYGAWTKPFRRFCVKNTFRFATKIFPVSEHACRELSDRMQAKHPPATVIYNCINANKFEKYLLPEIEKKIVLTVSRAEDYTEYILKGSDKFIRIASLMPDVSFVLAGLQGEALKLAKEAGKGLDNIQIIPGWLNLFEELVPLYKSASCYCQFSLEESFGLAVVEAMLFGAVPIVSNRAALPEVVGECGFVVSDDEAEIQSAIRNGLLENENERKKYKKHSSEFDISIRASSLLKEFE
ncbi:MAG: glycosyltransferase family 4 protein [Bacteroidota bacterium]